MELPDMMLIADRLQARVEEGEFADMATLLTALGRRNAAVWARNTWSARASTARPTGPTSSTRCPTTGSIWA
jgi:hypothetical protein